MPRPHLSLPVRPTARIIPPGIPADVLDPVVRHISERWRAGPGGVDHPLVVGRVFYLLPTGLLNAIRDELGEDGFDPTMWEVERRLADQQTSIGNCVGFSDGKPLIYTYLFARRRFSVPPDWQALCGISAAQAEEVSALVERRGPRFWGPARGYCGWLLTNPEFLAEHDRLLDRWADGVFDHWLPPLAGSLPSGPADSPPDMLAAFAAFHSRWRLTGLAGPYLPLPLAPQVPAPASGARPAGGVTIFLPDTFPVPSREELRDAIEDALRGGERPAHLAEWHALVRADNTAKKAIDRYGRLFLLQHLVAVVHARHGPALRRKGARLERALARYLLGDRLGAEDTIHKDLMLIRRRLGRRWYEPGEPGPSDNRTAPGVRPN